MRKGALLAGEAPFLSFRPNCWLVAVVRDVQRGGCHRGLEEL